MRVVAQVVAVGHDGVDVCLVAAVHGHRAILASQKITRRLGRSAALVWREVLRLTIRWHSWNLLVSPSGSSAGGVIF